MTLYSSTLTSTFRRWVACALVFVLAAAAGTPALAQNNGDQNATKQQLEELKAAYAKGVQAAKQNNSSAAYQNLEQALTLAQQTEQSGAAQKIQQYLTQLPRQWGNKALKNDNYEDALTHFEKGLEHNPEAPYMHYGRGLALINLDRVDDAMQALTQAMNLGQSQGDQRTERLARERIRDHYVSLASEALNAQNPTAAQADEALGYLEEMQQYVDRNASAYFYEATALYHQGQYQQAIETARQGLELHDGSRSSAAKFHFVIGEAYIGLGDMESACGEFPNAAYGDYQARADHYLENECQ